MAPKPHILITRLLGTAAVVVTFLFAFSSCGPSQKKAAPHYDTMPPPPPPPPPMQENNNSALSEATLKKIESTKTLLGAQLSTMGFTGNKENDFLVKVMQLNHSAISSLSSAGLGNAATNEELNKQADYFLNAVNLVSSHANKDVPSDTSLLKNSLHTKQLNEIRDELVRASKQYKESGMDPSVLSFATKIIKENGKENAP